MTMKSLLLFSLMLVTLNTIIASYVPFCGAERTSGKCNDDNDCCCGKTCDSFGYCV